MATHPLKGSGHYNPISIGDAAACPSRSLWWLLAAVAAGAAAGWQYSKAQKKGRR
jgi:hypothetical protein